MCDCSQPGARIRKVAPCRYAEVLIAAWLHLILDGSASLDPSHAPDVCTASACGASYRRFPGGNHQPRSCRCRGGGRYRLILTAPARLGAVVVIQVATANQLQESIAQTWIGSLLVGERASECQMPGSCLVSMAECIPETDAGPLATW